MSKGIAITYKGTTITSMDLDTSAVKTLLTSGKYLEDNITITVTTEAPNLIDYFGYTDNQRISTSDGGNRTKAGYTTIEYIDLSEFVNNETVTFRIKGAQFIHKSSPWDDVAYAFYNTSKAWTAGNYTNSGSHGNIAVTVTSTSDTDMTISITGLTSENLTSYHYLRLCGIGSGANVDIRVDN